MSVPLTTLRRTKIVATLGPATDAPGVLKRLLAAGVDVVRLNFSHGSVEDHRARAQAVRTAAVELGRDVGILVDLPGPKIRIEGFANGPVTLEDGNTFIIDSALPADAGTVAQVGTAYAELARDLSAGDTLLLNDGLIRLQVQAVYGTAVSCLVEQGGVLSDRKGLNKQGGGLSAPALTPRDRELISHAVDIGCDFLAVSFPKTGADMRLARQLAGEAGGQPHLVAKIERTEAVANLDEVLAASDAVMVARGDLAVEIGEPALPGVQKDIIRAAREANRVVITATQMMESMISNPIPTRAEVLDVANAVMDGTDAVMLSAESAAGHYPVQAVAAMSRICAGAEGHSPPRRRALGRLKSHFERIDEAVAMAAVYAAQHTEARAVLALTESGMTAVWMSRMDTSIPIFAMTAHETTRRRMALVRGVYPVQFTPTALDGITASNEAIAVLSMQGQLRMGDRVIVTKGDFNGPGGTNSLKILTVGD